MKKSTYFFSTQFILGSLFMLSGCYYDNAEELYPVQAPCDTENVSYNDFIVPLFVQECNRCHNAQTPLGGINLEDFSQVQITANNGSLLGSMKHVSNYSMMPPSGVKMLDCDLSKIEKWINDGMPNN
ncbi:hypothetical protein [Aureispira anguillae]|uniref:Cytochrome c domain-containing protein n=1 Tax=Aureispira anguillae TaxID=2864201 RepID=A0A915YC52_9BACT|nr:hypothetical protein [Aureispira anguillae]BDS10365.1 hypothetical protein AsAng_0010730 [Aureispira anguillae]